MAKKRRSRAESVAGATKQQKKINPFEFKHTKRKSNVLVKNASKTVVGAPGKSKKRAVDNRASTLAKEFEARHKSGVVKDRRLGASDTKTSKAEKAAMRFALERKLVSSKKDIYKLGEASDIGQLTHLGHSVADMEAFPAAANEDLDENLGEEFLARAHFGGGDLNDDDDDDAGGDAAPSGKKVSRKELIDQLIAKSKLAKHERQVQKDTADQQRESIDEQWKELSKAGALKSMVKPPGKDKDVRKSGTFDSYDALMRQLQFDSNQTRAGATERTKSQAELALAEKRRLEMLELERLRRMNQDVEKDDGDPEADDGGKIHLAYDKEGKLINSGILAKSIKAAKTKKRVSFASAKDYDNDREEQIESDNEQESDSDAGSEAEAEEEAVEKGNVDDVSTASTDIPFVLIMPESFSVLCKLLKGRRHTDVSVIMERLVKLHHPSLEAGNKRKLSRLFTMVLRYFDMCASKAGPPAAQVLDSLSAALFDLAQFDSAHAAKCVKALLKHHVGQLQKRRRRWPKFGTYALFGLIARLFPTSDRQHCVVTPALLAINAVLASAHIRNWRCVGRGLLLCSVLFDYLRQSKRYAPEAIGWLAEVLYAGGRCEEGAPVGNLPLDGRLAKCLLLEEAAPLDPIQPLSVAEIFAKAPKSAEVERPVDKVQSTLLAAVKLIRRFTELYADLPYFCGVFAPVLDLLKALPSHLYVHGLRSEVVDLADKLSSACSSGFTALEPLKTTTGGGNRSRRNADGCVAAPGGDAEAASVRLPADVPHIEMYEPRVETGFDPERKKRKSKTERAKLTGKLKRERRGAIRELRRDNEFIARKQSADRQRLDAERKLKTKRLMHSLKTQEGDFKALQKEKKKLKKKMGA